MTLTDEHRKLYEQIEAAMAANPTDSNDDLGGLIERSVDGWTVVQEGDNYSFERAGESAGPVRIAEGRVLVRQRGGARSVGMMRRGGSRWVPLGQAR